MMAPARRPCATYSVNRMSAIITHAFHVTPATEPAQWPRCDVSCDASPGDVRRLPVPGGPVPSSRIREQPSTKGGMCDGGSRRGDRQAAPQH